MGGRAETCCFHMEGSKTWKVSWHFICGDTVADDKEEVPKVILGGLGGGGRMGVETATGTKRARFFFLSFFLLVLCLVRATGDGGKALDMHGKGRSVQPGRAKADAG